MEEIKKQLHTVGDITQKLESMDEIRNMMLRWMKGKNPIGEGEASVDPEPEDDSGQRVNHPMQHKRTKQARRDALEINSSEEDTKRKMMLKRVKLLYFDGADPVGWVTRAKQFFEVHRTTEEMKIALAMVSME